MSPFCDCKKKSWKIKINQIYDDLGLLLYPCFLQFDLKLSFSKITIGELEGIHFLFFVSFITLINWFLFLLREFYLILFTLNRQITLKRTASTYVFGYYIKHWYFFQKPSVKATSKSILTFAMMMPQTEIYGDT